MSARIVRALHTTRALANGAPAAPGAPGAGAAAGAARARPPRQPRQPRPAASATDLGFSGEKRERVLPTLDIPKASRATVDLGGARPIRGDRNDRAEKGQRLRADREQREPREQRERQPREARQPRQPREAREAREAGEAPAAKSDTPASSEVDTTSKTKMDALEIPAEFFEGAELAPAVPTASSSRSRQRQQGQGQNRERRPREGDNRDNRDNRGPRRDGPRRDGPRRDGRDGKPREARARDDRDAPTVYSSALPVVHVTRDVSPRGLFGQTSILAPRPGAAAEPTASFWAKDMDRAAVYKTETLRRLGSYSIFMPPPPSGKTPLEAAKTRAEWVMGMNPTMSLRARAKGVEALSKLI